MSYLRELYPDEYRVLGIRMEAFTLGHAMLLERLESPFMTFARLPGRGDLKLALALCRRTYPRALEFIRRRSLGIGRWSFNFQRPWLLDQATQLAGIAQFQDYVKAFQRGPQTWNGRGGSRAMGTPFLLAVKLTHVMHLGKTDPQALGTPLSAALWEYACCWELLEKMDVVSDAERLATAAAAHLRRQRSQKTNGEPGPAPSNPRL